MHFMKSFCKHLKTSLVDEMRFALPWPRSRPRLLPHRPSRRRRHRRRCRQRPRRPQKSQRRSRRCGRRWRGWRLGMMGTYGDFDGRWEEFIKFLGVTKMVRRCIQVRYIHLHYSSRCFFWGEKRRDKLFLVEGCFPIWNCFSEGKVRGRNKHHI